MFGRKSNFEKELDEYAKNLFEVSAVGAKKLGAPIDGFALVMTQIASFSLMDLTRKMYAINQRDKNHPKKCILKVASVFAYNLEKDNSKRQSATQLFTDAIFDIIVPYGELPIKNDNPSQGEAGTLLWEYGKLMSETITGKERDLLKSMECISLVANLQNVVKIDKLLREVK